MNELFTALALAITLEGLIYAGFPEQMQRLLRAVMQTPPNSLRMAGLAMAGAGLVALWAIRAWPW